MTSHAQTWVKVNAHVDQGVAEIVELLNSVPHLQTVDSCQGEPGEAYVYFRLEGWQSLAKFLFEVVEPALRSVGESAVFIESLNGNPPLGKISFRAESCDEVLSALKEALSVSVHMSPYSGGNGRTGLHS